MDEATEALVKELHEKIAARDRIIAERDETIRALKGELIKKSVEADYPVDDLS